MSNPASPKHLGELLSLEYGSALPEQMRSGYGYPVFGSNGIVGHHAEFLINGPGIVVGRKGSVGEVCWSDESFWPIDTTYYVRARYDVDLRWLYWVLKHSHINKLDAATGVPGLNRHDAYRLLAFAPDADEQFRAAAVLDTIENAIEKTEALIAKLKQVRAGLLAEYLADQGASWDRVPLGDLGNWSGGSTPSKASSVYWNNGKHLWITPKDVRGTVLSDSEDKLSNKGVGLLKMFPAGSLIVVGRSGILRHSLPVAVVTRPFTVNQDVKVLPSTASDPSLPSYVSLALQYLSQQMLRKAVKGGTTVESVDWHQFYSFEIKLPPKPERDQIIGSIALFDASLNNEGLFLAKLQQIKLANADDLLTGRLHAPTELELA